jgi:hypothetical protein
MNHGEIVSFIWGVAPDHGDGSLEAIMLIALVTVITGLGMGYFHKDRARD